MATLRNLGLSIFTRYDGSGVRAARRDIDGFTGSVNRSTSAMNSWNGRIILAAKAIAVLGPALVPIAASFAAITAAAGAMGTAVGASLTVYGAAMGGAIKNAENVATAVGKAKQELAAQKAVLAGLTPGTEAYAKQLKKVQEAQANYNDALRQFTPVQRQYVAAVNEMQGAWAKFILATQGQTLQTATHAVRGLTAGIGLLKPVVDALHPSILAVSKAFEAWMKGDSAKNYAALITSAAVPALNNLIAAGRDVINVLGDGFRAFLPLGVSLTQALRNGAAALREWSDGGGFQRFLAYVQQVAPQVKDFFRALWDAFKNIGAAAKELAPLSLSLVTTFLRLVAAIPPGWIAAVVTGFIALKGALMGFNIISGIVAGIAGLVLRITALRLVMGPGAGLLGIIGRLLPFFAKFAGIFGLVATAVALAWKHSEFFRDRVKELWAALQQLWQSLQPLIQKIGELWQKMEPIRQLLGQIVGFILGSVVAAITMFVNLTTMAVNGITSLVNGFQSFLSWIPGAWSTVWNGIQTVASTVWGFIQTAWNNFVSNLKLVWDTVSAALRAAWDVFWNAIKTVVDPIWAALKAGWEAFINALRTVWDSVSGPLKAAWDVFWNALKTAGELIWNAMQAAWNLFITTLNTIWTTVSGILSTAWNTFWNNVKLVAETVWNALQVAWQAFITMLQTIWTTVSTVITAAWNLFWNNLKLVATTIWTALQTAWQAFWTFMQQIWTNASNLIKAAWDLFWNALKTSAENIWNAIKTAWEAVTNFLKETWDTASEAIKSAWEATWNFLVTTAKTIWNNIIGVVEDAVNFVIGVINKLIDGFNEITGFLDIDVKIGRIDEVSIGRVADGGMIEFAFGGIAGMPASFAHGGAVDFSGRGGALRGYAPGRDTVPAILSRGEGVLTPEAVRGLGGPGFVNGANREFAGHRGAGKSGPSFSLGGIQRFAVGGMTAAALARAGVPLSMVTQGEYSTSVAASAGTHAGSGVVDLATTSPSVLAALISAGFAAWIRTPAQGFSPHIHAVLMNSPDLSPEARAQVASFLAGGTGLGVGGGGGGGGGIDIIGMITPHVGKILHNVYRGLDALSGIGGAIASLFGGGGSAQPSSDDPAFNGTPDEQLSSEELVRRYGGGIVTFGPLPFTGRPTAAAPPVPTGESEGGGLLGGIGEMLGKIVLSLLDKDNIAQGLADPIGELKGWAKVGGGVGDIAVGFGNKLLNEVIPDYLLKKKEEAGPVDLSGLLGGGNMAVGNWASLASVALANAGIPQSQLGAFLALMQAESGGNPFAVNLTDSNALAGNSSRGLMQVTGTTFQAYRDPSLPNNIFDPLANMTAAANYIAARYNGVVPGSPYAEGTDNATPGMHLVGEEGPELVTQPGMAMFGGGEQVFNAAQTQAMLTPPAMPAPTGGGASGGGKASGDPMTLLQQLIEAAMQMREAISTAWTSAVSSGKSGWSALAGVHSGLIGEVGTGIPGAFNTMKTASATAWTGMTTQTLTNWAALKAGPYTEAQATATVAMPTALAAMATANGTQWSKMNTDSTTQWGLMRDTTFTEANDFIAVKMPTWADEMNTGVSTSFQNMNEATAESWGGMQEATRAPVNWIIENAYNNGLANLWNQVAEVIFEDGAKTLPTVATLAKGGPVNGPGTGTSDSIPARLSRGEHVWTAREVKAAGGHRAVQALRSSVMDGHPVRGAHGGRGFAAGGWVAGSDQVGAGLGLPALGELKRGFLMDEAEPYLDALDSGVRSALGGNSFRQMGAISGALSPSDWMRQYIEKDDELNKIGSGGPPWVPGVSDVITSWGGVTVNQRTADMLNMAIALGASFSATQGSFSTGVSASAGTHDGGGVVDLVPTGDGNVGALRAVGFAAWNRGAAYGSPSFSPHIHAVALGDPTVSPAAAAQIQSYLAGGNGLADGGPDNFGGGIPAADGVAAIAGGGRNVDPADLEQRVVAFDRGGWWKPGTFGYNGTGRMELATPADDLADIANGIKGAATKGECNHVEINFNGPVSNAQEVHRAAEAAIPRIRQAIQAKTGTR